MTAYHLDRLIPYERVNLGVFTTQEQAKAALESWAKDHNWHMQIRRVETELVYDNKAERKTFEMWCKSKGLDPADCDKANIWIRCAFEDATAKAA